MKRWVVGITLVLTFFLALSPWLPFTEQVWQVEDQQGFFSRLATLVGLQFAVLTTALTLILLDQGAEGKKWREELLERLEGAKIRLLRDRTFYSEFSAAAAGARHRVDICYFAPDPPDRVKRAYRDQYYRGILATIKGNPDAHFRRIVRRAYRSSITTTCGSSPSARTTSVSFGTFTLITRASRRWPKVIFCGFGTAPSRS